jgi:hypothetical protein
MTLDEIKERKARRLSKRATHHIYALSFLGFVLIIGAIVLIIETFN